MNRWPVLLLALLMGSCAIASKSEIDNVQARLRCGMSTAEVEALVGTRLQRLEARDPRLTHFYRSGMTDLWLLFDDDKLRSSQVVVVQGVLGTKEEPVVTHCKQLAAEGKPFHSRRSPQHAAAHLDEIQNRSVDRREILEKAKIHSLSGEYRKALALTGSLLERDPRDVDSLRLKGNILELLVLDREERHGAEHVYSPDLGKARACYEQILLIHADHPGALTDLGTHWKNVGDYEKALGYFNRVLSLYRSNEDKHRDEIVEAMEGKIEILQQQGDVAAVHALTEELGTIRADQCY